VRRRGLVFLAILCVVTLASTAATSAARHGASGQAACPDYYVVDSRGSGEPAGVPSPPADVLIRLLKVIEGFSQQVSWIANPYPASGSDATLAGALAHIPAAYHSSVVKGKAWLSAEVPKLASQCPATKLILTGYSQGAQVTGDVVQLGGPWRNVIGTVLWGDPYFNGNDLNHDRGNFDPNRNGALGSRPRFGDWRAISFCHAHDPVCQRFTTTTSQHENYQLDKEPIGAAALAIANIDQHLPPTTPLPGDSGRQFGVSDTSGITGANDVAVCPQSDLVVSGYAAQCGHDWSSAPIPSSPELWCTARFVNVVGHPAVVALGYSGVHLQDYPSVNQLTVNAPAEAGAAGLLFLHSQAPPGQAFCTVLLDGTRVAVKTFTIANK
jgi:hypothetical protein